MADLLLLLRDLESTDILFQLALGDAVIVLGVLERYLGFLLKLSQLIKVLENEMLDALLVDFDLDLVLLAEILQLALLVAELGLLVLELLLGDDPEVVNSLTFILVQTREVLLLSGFLLEQTALYSE